MAKKYVRYPGYSPRYSNFETALYVSRKARLMRGFALAPTRQSGDKYYFRSDRGPASTGGEWIVTVNPEGGGLVPNPAYFPNYDGGEYLPPYEATRSSSVTYTREGHTAGQVWLIPSNIMTYQAAVDQYGADNVIQRTTPGMEGTAPMVRQSAFEGVDPNKPLNDAYSTTFFDNASVSKQWFPLENYGGRVGSYAWTLWGRNRFAPDCDHLVDRYLYSFKTVEQGTGTVTKQPSTSRPYWWLPSYQNGVLSCLHMGPRTEGNPDPLIPSGGGGGGGGVHCAGTKSYACTCPDFTAEEHPYNVPLAPSHYRYRTWKEGPWQGIYRSLNFPCKHVVAAAYKERDWPNIFCWARAAAGDLPAKELWQQAVTSYNQWRDRYWKDRLAKSAARKAARDQHYDDIDRVKTGRDIAKPNRVPLHDVYHKPEFRSTARSGGAPPPPERSLLPERFRKPDSIQHVGAGALTGAIDADLALQYWDNATRYPGDYEPYRNEAELEKKDPPRPQRQEAIAHDYEFKPGDPPPEILDADGNIKGDFDLQYRLWSEAQTEDFHYQRNRGEHY